jgi:RNA polymerase sigma-70 factor, ECF subfamily
MAAQRLVRDEIISRPSEGHRCRGPSFPTVEELNSIGRMVKDSKPQGFVSLVERVYPRIAASIADKFPSLSIHAEDIASEGLARVWIERDQFDPSIGDIASWWYVISRNLAINLLKRNTPTVPLNDGLSDDRSSDSPEYRSESRFATDFREIFSRLRESDRRLLEEYATVADAGPYADALAKTWGVDANSIRVRIYRLRRYLGSEMNSRGHTIRKTDDA